MCRMFGFRGKSACPIQAELADADRSMFRLSEANPDGWGVGYYTQGVPHVVKSPTTAAGDAVYQTLARRLRAETVVAHVRAATQGPKDISNTQPYQFGRWLFTHNGNITDFPAHREDLLREVHADLRPFLLGQTDSEVFFFALLTGLERAGLLRAGPDIPPAQIWKALVPVVAQVGAMVGGLSRSDPEGRTGTYLTFLLTNGATLLGFQGGKSLYVHAPDLREARATPCHSAHHFLVASEPVGHAAAWHELSFGQAVSVDPSLGVEWHELPRSAVVERCA